jgi:hypothetical protein
MFLFVAPAAGQGVDVAGGWAFLHEEDLNVPKGWFAAVAGDVNKWLGIVGQVSGNYKTVTELGIDVDTNIHIFGAGPRFSGTQNAKLTPYGQVLFGVARVNASVPNVPGADFSETDFAVQPGAGIDITPNGRVGVRLQVAGTFIRTEEETLRELQFMVGIVFRNRR